MVWLFPEDVFYEAATGQLPDQVPGSSGGDNVVANGIANIVATVQILSALGAQNFLVPNMPDLGAMPEFVGTPSAPGLSALTAAFNANLAQALTALDALLPGDIIQFDTAAAVAGFVANPAQYGFGNVTDPCIQDTQCDPSDNDWLFWDGVHLTTYANSLLASQWSNALAPPDPATLLQQLASNVAGIGPGKSLADKVALAQTYLAASDVQATCAVLTDFVAQVNALAGKKKLTSSQAEELTSDVTAIMTATGCN